MISVTNGPCFKVRNTPLQNFFSVPFIQEERKQIENQLIKAEEKNLIKVDKQMRSSQIDQQASKKKQPNSSQLRQTSKGPFVKVYQKTEHLIEEKQKLLKNQQRPSIKKEANLTGRGKVSNAYQKFQYNEQDLLLVENKSAAKLNIRLPLQDKIQVFTDENNSESELASQTRKKKTSKSNGNQNTHRQMPQTPTKLFQANSQKLFNMVQKVLKRHSIFFNLSKEFVENLVNCLSYRSFSTQQLVKQQGSLNEEMLIVLKGKLQCKSFGTYQQQSQQYDFNLNQWDTFGAECLIVPEKSPCCVIGLEAGTVLYINQQSFSNLLKLFPKQKEQIDKNYPLKITIQKQSNEEKGDKFLSTGEQVFKVQSLKTSNQQSLNTSFSRNSKSKLALLNQETRDNYKATNTNQVKIPQQYQTKELKEKVRENILKIFEEIDKLYPVPNPSLPNNQNVSKEVIYQIRQQLKHKISHEYLEERYVQDYQKKIQENSLKSQKLDLNHPNQLKSSQIYTDKIQLESSSPTDLEDNHSEKKSIQSSFQRINEAGNKISSVKFTPSKQSERDNSSFSLYSSKQNTPPKKITQFPQKQVNPVIAKQNAKNYPNLANELTDKLKTLKDDLSTMKITLSNLLSLSADPNYDQSKIKYYKETLNDCDMLKSKDVQSIEAIFYQKYQQQLNEEQNFALLQLILEEHKNIERQKNYLRQLIEAMEKYGPSSQELQQVRESIQQIETQSYFN